MNDDRTMSSRYRGVIDNHIVIRQSSDAIESDFQCDLFSAIEEPAVGAGLFDWNIRRAQGFEIAGIGAEGDANLTGYRMSTGSVFHTPASGTKRVAAGITFEMNT